MTDPSPTAAAVALPATGEGVWVILPTYDEAENVEPMAAAILASLPAATLLVVDDDSPDGTGRLADALAAGDPRIRVRHRALKQGLGRAYLDGFTLALAGGATTIVQMDADFSHDPGVLPDLIGPLEAGTADLVIGSRYTRGGGVVDWGIGRRVVSARWQHLRPGGPRSRAERPDRGVQGLARPYPGGSPVRRRPRRWLRVPDRDDLPGGSERRRGSARSRSRSATVGWVSRR